MRLLCTITSKNPQEDPYAFSAFLKKEGIDNECEAVTLPDEMPIYRIWIVNEDDFPKAQRLYQEFQTYPQDERFLVPLEEIKEGKDDSLETKKENGGFLSPSPYGKLSILIITLCILLFIWSQAKRPSSPLPPQIPDVVQAPLFSQLEKDLLFDYPHYFSLRDQLLKVYTPEDIKEDKTPSSEAQAIINQMQHTPFWSGFYERIVNYFRMKNYPLFYQGPIFEKISQGELWRLLSPAFLHFNLLHIFFNLLWFIVLGNQIEFRIGFWRFLILFLSTAILSNISQYLMSGSFFMGLSGVVVGLVGFIYARQRKAFWEGYLLNKMTFLFLFAFIFGMFALQSIFFFIEIFSRHAPHLVIANTAHIVGGITGYLLGLMPFFSIRHKKK